MDKKSLYDYIVASVTLINLTEDVGERERLFNKLISVIDAEGIGNAEWFGYENRTVYNSYINWDANCGFQLVEASADFEEVMEYVDPDDLEMALCLWMMGDPLCEDGNRDEYSTDLIYGRDDDTPVQDRYKFMYDAEEVAECLVSLINDNEGEREFIADVKKYIEANKKPTKANLYDKMCGILTDYEEFKNEGFIFNKGKGISDFAENMYSMLVEIQNNWETVITAQEN